MLRHAAARLLGGLQQRGGQQAADGLAAARLVAAAAAATAATALRSPARRFSATTGDGGGGSSQAGAPDAAQQQQQQQQPAQQQQQSPEQPEQAPLPEQVEPQLTLAQQFAARAAAAAAAGGGAAASPLAAAFGARKVAPAGGGRGGPARREGVVHVNASFNNTILVLTDRESRVQTWTSGGTVGYRNANKATPQAAELAAKELARRALDLGFHAVTVKLKGMGKNKQFAVQSLAAGGLTVTQLWDVTPIPYNGCRLPRRRRALAGPRAPAGAAASARSVRTSACGASASGMAALTGHPGARLGAASGRLRRGSAPSPQRAPAAPPAQRAGALRSDWEPPPTATALLSFDGEDQHPLARAPRPRSAARGRATAGRARARAGGRRAPLSEQAAEAWVLEVPLLVAGEPQHLTPELVDAARRAALPPLAPPSAGAGAAGPATRPQQQREPAGAEVVVLVVQRPEGGEGGAAPAPHAAAQPPDGGGDRGGGVRHHLLAGGGPALGSAGRRSPEPAPGQAAGGVGLPAAAAPEGLLGVAALPAATVATQQAGPGVPRGAAAGGALPAPPEAAAPSSFGGPLAARPRLPPALPSRDGEQEDEEPPNGHRAGAHGSDRARPGLAAALRRALGKLRSPVGMAPAP
ncbi:rpsK [Scenedesmus sp. PABB004]|nr:rpsK [Scenedesmus sp. PABB004]